MTTARAKHLITNSVSMPTLPAVVQRVGDLLKDPTSGPREISALVAEDPTLAARVLKIANSAYYGLSQPCVSTDQASVVLGVRVLRNVVTQAAVTSRFDHIQDHSRALDELWRHAQLTARVSSLLAHRSRVELGLSPEEFHACGLLHEIGKIVMLENMGQEFLDVIRRSEVEKLPPCLGEEQRFGFNHTDVGAMLAVHWGLPAEVVSVIQFHHGPREAIERNRVVLLVANANLLVHHALSGDHDDPIGVEDILDESTLEHLGLSTEDIVEAIELARRTLARAA
jgi:putative nucleotidyltransferase with HDIG domain